MRDRSNVVVAGSIITLLVVAALSQLPKHIEETPALNNASAEYSRRLSPRLGGSGNTGNWQLSVAADTSPGLTDTEGGEELVTKPLDEASTKAKGFAVLDGFGNAVTEVKPLDKRRFMETEKETGDRYLYKKQANSGKYKRYLVDPFGTLVPRGHSVKEGDSFLVYDEKGNLVRKVEESYGEWRTD